MNRLIIIALCMLFTFSSCAFQKEIIIPRAKIQEVVSQKFPFDRNILIANLTVKAPEVYFKGKSIGLKLSYNGNFLEEELEGSADFNGNIIYKSQTGAFYLGDLIISDITVNEHNFSEKNKLQKLIDDIISNYLDDFPVYRLNPDDFKENLARLLVKDVFIRNDDVIIVLGKLKSN
ncbi:MAG: DUF1439 domain-containing protein [Pseudomonadota bacterium]